MEIDSYKPTITAKKAALPLGILIIMSMLLSLAKQADIEINDALAWKISLAGYAGILTFVNWIKNRKRGK
jgi:hypothetical protein